MPTLSSSEIQEYRSLRVSSMKSDSRLIRRLKAVENELGRGLPYYVAEKHHLFGYSLRRLASDLGLSYDGVRLVFETYGIPKLTRAEASERSWQYPEVRDKNREALRQMLHIRWQDPEFRSRQAEAVRNLWSDSDFRARASAAFREKRQDPVFHSRQAQAASRELRRRWRNPEYRREKSEGMRRRWKNPEFRKRISESMKRKWNDPEFRARIIAAVRSSRYGVPFSGEESEKLLGLYDRIAPRSESYEEAVGRISQQTKMPEFRVRRFFDVYLSTD